MAAYLLVEIYQIHDPAMYRRYIEAVPPLVEQHGGHYILRSDRVAPLFGSLGPKRIILIRFPDKQSLTACFTSDAYLKITPLRENSTQSQAFVIEQD